MYTSPSDKKTTDSPVIISDVCSSTHHSRSLTHQPKNQPVPSSAMEKDIMFRALTYRGTSVISVSLSFSLSHSKCLCNGLIGSFFTFRLVMMVLFRLRQEYCYRCSRIHSIEQSCHPCMIGQK
mmetsp:Transcript_55695/g.113621  ORF Transcript_55695/g.113621 Transcript_55695/m.113621 type:complete len:123 (+) Transcript_55695:211-579(+)